VPHAGGMQGMDSREEMEATIGPLDLDAVMEKMLSSI